MPYYPGRSPLFTYIHTTAAAAREAGEAFYFDEYELCRAGHQARRYASTYECVTCCKIRSMAKGNPHKASDIDWNERFLVDEEYIPTSYKPIPEPRVLLAMKLRRSLT